MSPTATKTTSARTSGSPAAGTSRPTARKRTTHSAPPRTTTPRKVAESRPSSLRELIEQATSAAEAVVNVPVGLALIARDTLATQISSIIEPFRTRTSAERELKSYRTQLRRELERFERRGNRATVRARRELTRELKRSRTRVERTLKIRRTEAERRLRRERRHLEGRLESGQRRVERRADALQSNLGEVLQEQTRRVERMLGNVQRRRRGAEATEHAEIKATALSSK